MCKKHGNSETYKDGKCKVCVRERAALYRSKNAEKIKAYRNAYDAKNSEAIKAQRAAYYEANKAKWTASYDPIEKAAYNAEYHRRTYKGGAREKAIVYAKQWANANPESRLAIVKKSRNASGTWKAYVRAWKKQSGDVAKRRAAKNNRTPPWLTEDDLWLMREAYSLRALRDRVTGAKWHVDHIVPLRGMNVCGLHVPDNLQVITAALNLAKGSKLHFQLKELPK